MSETSLLDSSWGSKLVLDGYQIDKIDFRCNPKFQFEKPIEIPIGLGVNIDIQDREQKRATITLLCKIFEGAEENNYPFSLIVALTGAFVFDGEIDHEGFLNFCKTSGTAALFPFLRSAIANITAVGNMQPVMLPLINVHNFLKDLEMPKSDQSATE